MIACLSGRIILKDTASVIINVNGIGYQVFMPQRFYDTVSDEATLWVHHVFRDAGQALYGFLTPAYRTAFGQLIGISGVGPRIALAILDRLTLAELAQAIYQKNGSAFTGITGLGKKMAERIIIDLADKVISDDGPSEDQGNAASQRHRDDPDLQLALQSLGYKPAEIKHMLRNAVFADTMTLAEKIAHVLKQ